MNCKLRQYALRLFFAATAFTLGLASSELWQSWPVSPPPARYAASAATAIPVLPTQGGCASSQSGNDDEESRVEDRYYNYNYGFSVDLPSDIVGGTSPPPMPQHGFGIDLDNPRSIAWIKSSDFPKSYISVDASYNSLEWKSLDEAVNESFSYIETDPGSKVTLLRRSVTSLAGLRAAHFVARYMKDGEAMVSDQIIAFRGKERDVVYTIDLDTPEANYERDKAVVAEMQKTWCLQPLP